jgi:hypothetical protein
VSAGKVKGDVSGTVYRKKVFGAQADQGVGALLQVSGTYVERHNCKGFVLIRYCLSGIVEHPRL